MKNSIIICFLSSLLPALLCVSTAWAQEPIGTSQPPPAPQPTVPIEASPATAPIATQRAEASLALPTGRSSISGNVTSDKNVPLPGIIVSAVNLTTGTQRAVAADGNGHFVLTDMLPGGPYVVQARLDGFLPLSVTNVYLAADKETPFKLQLITETVAVGTRRADRSALESAVPVDVVEMEPQAQQSPQTDVTQLLNYVVPSFNATRQTNAGGSDFVELGSLRGLGTDQMLVLVNGKRRHTTALLGLTGNRGVGTVGTDLNTLPSNGIARVEILRDGAAAQYGSDAIAGVMNIALKSNDHGGNVLASSGLTSYGDGYTGLLSVNKGFKLGEKGFLSITADADYRQPTTRSYARNGTTSPVFVRDAPNADATALANAGKSYSDYGQRNGDARTNNYRMVLNTAFNATDKLKFYAFGGYNFRKGEAMAPWVLPATQPGDIVDTIYPLGYAPVINTRIHDASGAAGAILDLGKYSLDVSHTVGYNRMRYEVSNTLNSSLGSASPTSFDAGGYQFTQNVTNATINRLFAKALRGTNVAVGGEVRTDSYAIVAGESGSFDKYDDGKPDAAGGSQGFTGFSTASALAGQGSRRNVGAFLDVDANVTKMLTVSTALRYENYSDFGSAFIYKATARYQLARFLAVRGAFNSGFRAPSLQQVLYRQTTTNAGLASGIFNNQDAVTRAAGIPALNPEKSRSYSAGLVLTPTPNLTLTFDGYQINIDDRIILTGLLGQGINQNFTNVLVNNQISGARFFTNGVNTRTQGLDVVARYQHSLGRGTLTVNAAGNFSHTDTLKVNVPDNFKLFQNADNIQNKYVDQRQISLLTTGSPQSKILLHLGYELGKFNVLLRNTYYGKVSYYDTNTDVNNVLGSYFLVFKPRVVTDLLVTYSPIKSLALTAGVNNLLNVLPNTISEAASNGRLPDGYSSQAALDADIQRLHIRAQPEGRDVYPYAPVQMGYGGTFAYLKVAYNFGM